MANVSGIQQFNGGAQCALQAIEFMVNFRRSLSAIQLEDFDDVQGLGVPPKPETLQAEVDALRLIVTNLSAIFITNGTLSRAENKSFQTAKSMLEMLVVRQVQMKKRMEEYTAAGDAGIAYFERNGGDVVKTILTTAANNNTDRMLQAREVAGVIQTTYYGVPSTVRKQLERQMDELPAAHTTAEAVALLNNMEVILARMHVHVMACPAAVASGELLPVQTEMRTVSIFKDKVQLVRNESATNTRLLGNLLTWIENKPVAQHTIALLKTQVISTGLLGDSAEGGQANSGKRDNGGQGAYHLSASAKEGNGSDATLQTAMAAIEAAGGSVSYPAYAAAAFESGQGPHAWGTGRGGGNGGGGRGGGYSGSYGGRGRGGPSFDPNMPRGECGNWWNHGRCDFGRSCRYRHSGEDGEEMPVAKKPRADGAEAK